jgi:uncharacterized protein (TIGR02996 family)
MTSRHSPLRLAVGIRGQRRHEFAFERFQIDIGRVRENDLVLDHRSVADRHARIVVRGDHVILVDLVSANGTTINDVRVDRPTLIDETDVVGIGPYHLEVLRGDPPDEVERGFLEAIQARPLDDEMRAVYADWLEEQGRADQAELVRAQLAIKRISPRDPTFAALASRIADLAPTMPRSWRRAVAAPPIENCAVRFELACPQRWDALVPTDSPNRRHCDVCKKDVHYARTIDIARRLALAGDCVAVDVDPRSRREGDLLHEPMRTVGMIAPPARDST